MKTLMSLFKVNIKRLRNCVFMPAIFLPRGTLKIKIKLKVRCGSSVAGFTS